MNPASFPGLDGRRRSIKVTDPLQQRLAAETLVKYGHGDSRHILVGAIQVSGKRARKLLIRAKRAASSGGAS